MGNRTFNLIVVMFWLSTMTWLMFVKVVPWLRTGDPPAAQALLVQKQRDLPPVCWRMRWNDRPIGWAATKVVSDEAGGAEVLNRVQFHRHAISEVPPMFRMVLHSVLGSALRMELALDNRMQFDSANRLLGFQSHVLLDNAADPLFTVFGTLDGEELLLELLSAGEPLHRHKLAVGRALVGDEFSPQSYMPHLYEGRTWTQQVYSPLPSPTQPGKLSAKIVEAKVERIDPVLWDNEVVPAWLVVYREADGGSGSPKQVGRMWVRRDGMVLRQEMNLLGAQLRFDRLTESEAGHLAGRLDADWQAAVPHAVSEEFAVEARVLPQ